MPGNGDGGVGEGSGRGMDGSGPPVTIMTNSPIIQLGWTAHAHIDVAIPRWTRPIARDVRPDGVVTVQPPQRSGEAKFNLYFIDERHF